MFGLGKYIGIAAAIVIAGLLAWGLRVDSLRGGYKAQLEAVVLAVVDIGEPKPSFDKLPDTVRKIDGDRQGFKKERDDARAVVDLQAPDQAEAGRALVAALDAEPEHAGRGDQVGDLAVGLELRALAGDGDAAVVAHLEA